MNRNQERRRFGRINLEAPLRGEINGQAVVVIELSRIGARIRHQGRLARETTHTLRIHWNEHTLQFRCEIVRSTVARLAKKAGETSLYDTGVRLTESFGDSEDILRELIGELVLRAINEQLANARGIPPLAAYSYQCEKGDRYRRCELVDGVWRKAETTDPKQPSNGFTISAEVEPKYIDLLCRTWERADAEVRRLTQIFAQLSISKAEGIPTRRYIP